MPEDPQLNPDQSGDTIPGQGLNPGQKSFLESAGGYSSIQDIMGYAESSLAQKVSTAKDPYAKGKISPVPLVSLGYPMYYKKTAYKRLGFNPFENNYENYSKNTTNWELFLDAQKAHSAMHNSMFSMFGIGGGDPSSYLAARQYEDLVEMGSPIGRDDTYAYALKQYVQAGYTTAIVSSIVAEELALGAGTLLTRGKMAGAAWARTVKNLNRLANIGDVYKGVSGAKRIYDMGKMSKKAKSTLGHLNDIQDVSKARSFWTQARLYSDKAMKGLSKVPGKLGSAAFPHLAGYVRAVREGKYALNGFANANHAFGAFWRTAREFNLAIDESNLERAFVERETMSQLTEAYKEKHGGKNPQGKDLDRLQEIAKAGGDSTFLVNAGLIYMTNRIGFGTLFNKFAPKVFSETIRRTKYGKLYVNPANLKKGLKAQAKFVRTGLWNQIKFHTSKSSLKAAPLRTGKWMIGASAMASTEGVQEYFQEVIQDAETRRAVDSYTKGATGSMLDYYGQSMQKYLSPEGAEVFMSGFLMGGFAGPHRLVTSKGADLVNTGMEWASGNYKKNKQHKRDMQDRYEKQVNHINEMFNKPWSKDVGFGGLTTYANQDERVAAQNEAVENGDEKTFRDITDDNTLEVIYNAIDKGTFDTLIDQLSQMDQLSDEELLEAFSEELGEDAKPEDIIAFRKDIGQVIQRAKYIKELRQHSENDYINPFHYATEMEEEDTTFGYNQHFLYKAFEYAKKQIVKNQYSYKRSLERMSSIMEDFATHAPFWNKEDMGSSSDYTILLNDHDLHQEIDMLGKEIKGLEEMPSGELSPQQARELKHKKEMFELLNYKEVMENGKKVKKPGLRLLLNQLRRAYQEESLNKLAQEQFEKGVKEGKIKPTPGVGATVNLKTKAGGKGEIVDESDTQWKVKRESGRSYWYNKDNVELDPATIKIPGLEGISDPIVEKLHKAFKDYMEFLAKKNNNTVKDADVDAAFKKLLDFYALDQDSKNMSQLLNMLLDPQGFQNTMIRKAEIEEHIWKNKKDIIADSLEETIKSRQKNFLVQELKDKHNAGMLEEDAIKLFEDDTIPDQFYDLETSKPIDKISTRHKKIVEEIQEYLDNRWKRERAAKTEYNVTDVVFPEDLADTEANAAVKTAIEEQIKENKKVRITDIGETNEDGTVNAEVLIGDKNIAVTLRPIQPEEEDAAAPVPKDKIADIQRRRQEELEKNPKKVLEELNSKFKNNKDLSFEFAGTGRKAESLGGNTTYHLIVKKGNRQVGTVDITINDGKVEIAYTQIFKEFQKQGIASSFYQSLNQVLVSEGYGVLHSDTTFLEEEINKSDVFYYLDGKELTLSETSDFILNTPEEEIYKLEEEGRLVKREKEYVQPGVKLWKSLVEKGLAEKIDDKQYRFKYDAEPAALKEGAVADFTEFDAMPESVQKEIVEAMRQHNERIATSKVSEQAKRRATFETVDDFLDSDTGRSALVNAKANYEAKRAAKEEISKPVTPARPKARGVDEEPEETVAPVAEIKLEAEELDKILNEQSTLVTLPLDIGATASIVNALIKAGIQKPGDKYLTAEGAVVKMPVTTSTGEKVTIKFTYKGKVNLEGIGRINTVITKLGLPTTATEQYRFPIEVGDKTYYAKSKAQQLWFKSGKQHVFIVEPGVDRGDITLSEEEDLKAYEAHVEKTLTATKTRTELEAEKTLLIQGNIIRLMEGKLQMDVAKINAIYEAHDKKLISEMKPKSFKEGEVYEMTGKLRKFGVGVVDNVTSADVTFTNPKTKETVTVKAKELPHVVSKQITDMDETIAEAQIEMTPEEEKLNETNKKNVEEFSKDSGSIGEVLDKADTMSDEEADKDFLDNLGCD